MDVLPNYLHCMLHLLLEFFPKQYVNVYCMIHSRSPHYACPEVIRVSILVVLLNLMYILV